MERRLAAVLVADVVGFSALVGRDEERAINALKAHISSIQPMIGFHSGRIFKSTGDGFLAEFGSVVDAVSCAGAMQKQFAGRNENEPADHRLDFRMGVHSGDVVVDGADMLGDGVNIAARLEALADPGGVVVSARVRDDVQGKLDIEFTDRGLQELKNIRQPVHVYSIGAQRAPAKALPVELPDKPSVVVLPFANMSSDPEDDYFADGVSEDITTALSYVPWIFVIARNSAFSYKGLSVDVRKIGQDLGVRYVLEGSVRRSGQRLRVTGQLIGAETGTHIWAERFDGVVEDIFDLQDGISEAVVTAIAPEIQNAEIKRGMRKRPDNLDAYDMYLRAQNALHLGKLDEADDWLVKSIELAPDYAKAIALRAWVGTAGNLYGRITTPDLLQSSLALAHRAMELEPTDPEVMAYAGYTIGFYGKDMLAGLDLVERATDRCPSFAWAWTSSSILSVFSGQADQATERANIALRLSPRDPMAFRNYMALAIAELLRGNYQGVLDHAQKGIALNPAASVLHRYVAVALSELGRRDEAEQAVARAMELTPGFKSRAFIKYIDNSIGVADSLWTNYEAALIKAGFPE